MARAAFVVGGVLSVLSLGSAAYAQSTGVVACDDFLKKYESCVTTKVPEAQRAMCRSSPDLMVRGWPSHW